MKKSLIIIGLLFCVNPDVFAWSAEIKNFQVERLRLGATGIAVRFNPAPAACNGGDSYGMHASVNKSTHDNYNAMTSALLTAYTTKKPLRAIWVNNEGTCSNSHMLSLEMIEFSNQ